MKTMKREWISGTILLLISVLYYYYADNLASSMLSDEVGADGYPKLLAGALFIFSALLLVSSILKGISGKAEKVDPEKAEKDKHLFKRAGGALVIGIVYLVLLPLLGYIPSVVLLLGAVVIYNGGKLNRKLVLFSILGSLFFWLFFVFLLDVPMPAGIWTKIIF